MNPKVLFILHLPPPVHGASMVGQYIQESPLINNHFDAYYINLSTSDSLEEIGKGGLNKLLTLIKIQLKLVKLLLKYDFQLCYVTLTAATPGFYKDLLIVIILKIFRKKIVYHFHNKGVKRCSQNGINRYLYSFIFNNANCILLSKHLYSDISDFVKQEQVYYCANGIPLVNVNAINKKAINNSADLPCKLLFLSNMMTEKGVFILLEACKLLKDRMLNFECHFVGHWSTISESEFDKMIIQLNLAKHVFAHGKQYGDDKAKFFNDADIFVFPTYYHNECFPLVLLEAMQYALPIISTPEGGITDIVNDEVTGYIVKQKDYIVLADKIELLINHRELRTKMGLRGRQRFNELFKIDQFEQNLFNILEILKK